MTGAERLCRALGARPSYRQIAEAEQSNYYQVRERSLADGSAHLPVLRTDGRITKGSRRDRPNHVAKVRELRGAGLSIRAIAAALGCSTRTVQDHLTADFGAERRRRARRLQS